MSALCFMVVIYFQQHLPRVLFIFHFRDCALAFPESTLLLRGAVCLTQNLVLLTAQAGLALISVVVWTFFFFFRHLLLQHPTESAALVAQFHTHAPVQHLMALLAFLAALLNDVLIARILLHNPTGVSHGCT